MLTKSQYQILESLASIKKHNSNSSNMKFKFQSSRFNKADIDFVKENKLARVNLLEELQITALGEKELLNKL